MTQIEPDPGFFYPGGFDLLVTVARKCLKIEPGPDFWIPYQFPGKLWDKILFYRSIKTILEENYPKSRSRWGPEKNQPERRCETRFFWLLEVIYGHNSLLYHFLPVKSLF